jgi:hypothetical protein
MSNINVWLSDNKANRYTKTYFKDYVDISGDLIIRTGAIKSYLNTISFNDITGFINFGNSYFGSAVYVYNPTTLSNIDFVSYVNNNDSNISSINSSITSANSNISTNTSSISTINSKIGTLSYDNIYNFTLVDNLFINPGGTIQYEDAFGNHPDLIPTVISNTNNISTNTSNIATNTTNIATNTSSITTLNSKTTDISYLAGTPNTTTIANKLSTSVLSFGTTLNGVSSTTFGYISTLSANAQTALDSKCSLSGAQTIAGIKTFSSPPVMSGASITSNTIPLTSIVGTVCDLASAQTIAGIKTFSSAPVLSSNLRLDGSLIVNANALTLTNANLQKIQYLSTVSSDVQTQLNNKIGLSNNNTYTGSNTYSGSAQFNSQFYIYSASPSIQIENGNTLRQWSNGTTGDVVMELAWDTGSSSTGFSLQGGTNGTRGLFGLYFCTNVSAGTRLPIMYSKDTGTQLTNILTIASGTTACTNITFSGTLNSVSSTTFGYISGLTSSAQTQLDNKGGLATTNYWTNGNNFNGQLAGGYNASGTIYGTQTEMFFTGHRSWANGGASTLGSNVYEMSLDTGFYNRGLTIQGGESNTAGVGARGSIFGLYYRTYINGGTDPTRTPIMYGTDLETGAINNTLTIPSSLRLYGDLKLFSGDVVTNAQLNYLSTLSSNVQTQLTSNTNSISSHTSSITTLNTKTTDISFISGTTNKTKIVNDCETSNLTFLTNLNGISTTIFGYLSGLTSNIQTQLTSLVSSITTINSKLPVGMIIQHPKNNLASPYLLCNGSAVSRTTYSALFTSIGTLYGAGDGSTTFNLPNYQACFLRMYGNQTIGSTTYNTASVGTAQNDTVIGHTHSGQSGQFLSTSTSTTTVNGYASIAVQKPSASNFGTTGGVNSGGSGSETAPAHHCIYFYILAL